MTGDVDDTNERNGCGLVASEAADLVRKWREQFNTIKKTNVRASFPKFFQLVQQWINFMN